jgi:beta-xylosidase
MYKLSAALTFFLLSVNLGFGQARSLSFYYYVNPVIPGDHPDCTLTKVGKDYYTTGSSFNPTPVIYHSTDLVHWEAIAQPVSAAWTNYDDKPSGGCWGGQVVNYNNKWWDFFGQRFTMYFVTADDIRGPWSVPTLMNCPASVPGLGADNSIFIDDDGSWYLLVKNGQANNWIVQLGSDGQPNGAIYNLCWINPAPSYPFSWAEGPVMWKHNGYYYYSFARNVAGGQKVLRSATLTDSSSSWVNLGDFFNLSDPLATTALFQNPNHCSAAVTVDNGTSWVLHPLWRNANNNEWYGQGRQGLLNQVFYDAAGKPTADYPVNEPKFTPMLPSSGIPWMVPHSDFFTSTKLNPEWSLLGYTAENTHSLTTRPGWLTLSPRGRNFNTVIKNDGEHNYSVITRIHFDAQVVTDQAGIWIFNGLQTLFAKLYSSVDSAGNKIVAFSYQSSSCTVNSPVKSGNDTLLLKLVRTEHALSGYCSPDGYNWIQVGGSITVADMDGVQPNYNAWTGNRQGLFVQGRSADFDFYIYRDAYTPIAGECPANQYGTSASFSRTGSSTLDNIHDGDWALYAGVEFGTSEYVKEPESLIITASCASAGGVVQVWLDSLDTGTKIAECSVSSTGDWSTFAAFSARILTSVSGNHDVYLKFKGTGTDRLFMLQSLVFKDKSRPETSVGDSRYTQLPGRFDLEQNYPNPFNPRTAISYQLTAFSYVRLSVHDVLGREVTTLVDQVMPAGTHTATWHAHDLPSGVYVYRIIAGNHVDSKKMVLMK